MLINNCIERGSENKYFPFIVRIISSIPTCNPPQNENTLFSIKKIGIETIIFSMVFGIGINGLVQFVSFEAITVFGLFVLLNLENLLQYFV